MSTESQTLYRKYRPQTFDEVLGQNEIVNILKNSIKNKNLSHAYLFSGDRGTGKTSIARIFAKELGCSPDDIFELDAASNRGIGEIRELREAVNIQPLNSPYKVYIIDEVHMLTKDAFNALLKTLEEPPKYIIFILATTEKEKLLPTIISRCQVFDFKNPNIETLSELIKLVVKKEKRKIDQESIIEIAKKGKGSFRDTLSVLQKVLASVDGEIKIKNFGEVFGISSSEAENNFLKKLEEKDKEGIFEIYFKLKDNNFNFDLFLDNLITKVRNSLLLKNSNYILKNYSFSDKDFLISLNLNSLVLKKLLEVQQRIETSLNKEAAFEIFLFDFFE